MSSTSSTPGTPGTASQPPAPTVAEPALPGVYRIACPFGQDSIVHVYYVDAPQPALIDSGVLRSPGKAIGPALQRAGFSLGAVRHLFNTHGHWDHMGGNLQVRAAAPGCRTYAHQEDAYLLADVEQHARGYSTIQFRLLDDAPGREAQAAMLRRSVGTPAPVDEWIVDGARYDLGGGISLRALHTPGHSRGSTSYLLEGAGRAGVLFTGDGVQGLGSRPGQLPLIFDDSHAYRATIARLSGVPCGALCLGHSFCGLGPESGRDPVRQGEAARTYLEESGEAAKAVEEAMRSVLAPGAAGERDFLSVARATLQRVAGPLGVELDGQGLSPRSVVTLHAFYRELTGAPLPE
ncbi:MAG TPA: MBL fold metallo-hydrolase [Chloroflexota bacterium]|nr:MBL fold metallo-hydrolase [Chloroflexota bacterium]